jgi:hypothetical protein
MFQWLKDRETGSLKQRINLASGKRLRILEGAKGQANA